MNGRDLLAGVTESLSRTAKAVESVVLDTVKNFKKAAEKTLDTMETRAATTQPAQANQPTQPDPEPEKPKRKKGRARTDCSANITASLSLLGETKKTLVPSSLQSTAYSYLLTGAAPAKYIDDGIDICKDMEILERDICIENDKSKETIDMNIIEQLQLRKVELVKTQIIEHAARRADLFFYLLIAVYGKNVTACKDETTKQHGRGHDELGTAGCHSSLFPGIKFTYNNVASSSIFNRQPTGECPLLEDTYFAEALNSTVELPTIVNDFDGHLEGRAVKRSFIRMCEETLDRCAKSEIDPAEGMNEFYQIMNKFFIVFEEKHLSPHKKTIENFKAHRKIWEYERQGTFSGADPDTLKIQPGYLKMILKMNSIKDILPYDHYYRVIQNELLDKLPNESKQNRRS